jgi:hypothetical protein
MAGTNVTLIPAGTQTAPFLMTPMQSLCAGTQVQGGTVLVESAATQSGPWFSWSAGSSGASASFRPIVNSWVRVTATGQQAVAALTDFAWANSPYADELVAVNSVLATPNLTTEQILFSTRIPPGYLPANFRMRIEGGVTVTNNVNVKTLFVRMNGVTGTLVAQYPSLASNANFVFTTAVVGIGDGATLKGLGAGTTGGFGLSATAYSTLAFNYLTTELEVVVSMSKATGTDTGQLDSLQINLF